VRAHCVPKRTRQLAEVKGNPIARALAVAAGVVTIGVIVAIFVSLLSLLLPTVILLILLIVWVKRSRGNAESFTCPSCRQVQMVAADSPRGQYLVKRTIPAEEATPMDH
jgi:hypothetical protein